MSRRYGATRKAVLSCFRQHLRLTDACLAWRMNWVGITHDAAVAARRQLVLLGCVRLRRWIVRDGWPQKEWEYVREEPAIAARRRRLLTTDPRPLTHVSEGR